MGLAQHKDEVHKAQNAMRDDPKQSGEHDRSAEHGRSAEHDKKR